ncbi:MAG: hypothetical protein JO329_28825, partial [Planctomycetaceae bacterium]|nr:hypothetical protein [Planctomycetaceae bacterium]
MVSRLRVVGVLLLVLGGIAALMGRAEAFDPPPLLHSSLRSPVLAIELVRSADDARSVLRDPEGEHNRAVMRRLIDLDWSFIAAYALAFCGLGLVLRACRGPGARALSDLPDSPAAQEHREEAILADLEHRPVIRGGQGGEGPRALDGTGDLQRLG